MNSLFKTVLAFCLSALCICMAACRGGVEPLSSPEPTREAQAEAVTPEPAEQTEAPDMLIPAYDGRYLTTPSYTKWLYETAHAILNGKTSKPEYPENRGMQGIVFIADETIGGAEPQYVNAFSSSLMLTPEGNGDLTIVYTDPVLHIPFDTAVKAENRLYDIIEEHGPKMIRGEGFTEIEGFCGEDWFMLQSDGLLNVAQRMHTIWRRDESGSWYEFGSNNAELARVTGVNILSDKTGFMCCYSFGYEEGRASRLFATFDGGVTWQDMELVPSEEYQGYNSFHLSGPVFDGERGVVLFTGSYLISENETEVRRGYFLTEDGGHSWEFSALG